MPLQYARGSKPFAMHLSIGTPHDPWGPDNVPPEYCAMFADEGQTQGFTLPPNYKPKNDPYADAGGWFKGPHEREAICLRSGCRNSTTTSKPAPGIAITGSGTGSSRRCDKLAR